MATYTLFCIIFNRDKLFIWRNLSGQYLLSHYLCGWKYCWLASLSGDGEGILFLEHRLVSWQLLASVESLCHRSGGFPCSSSYNVAKSALTVNNSFLRILKHMLESIVNVNFNLFVCGKSGERKISYIPKRPAHVPFPNTFLACWWTWGAVVVRVQPLVFVECLYTSILGIVFIFKYYLI